ncbi:peroxiredoxin [Frateuria aurantia]
MPSRSSLCLALALGTAVLTPHAFAATSGEISGPAVGQPAPAFKLEDQAGHWRSLDQYRHGWLVLYFYPKDFTPGCTSEVCTFRDDVAHLRQAGASVVGVSLDGSQSHAQFAAKYHVPFPLLADVGGKVATTYGVLTSRGDVQYARRETFLIDPQGRIAKIYRDVDPQKNSSQVLADLAALGKGA